MHVRTAAAASLVASLVLFANSVHAAELLDQHQDSGGEFSAFYQPRGCPSAGVKAAAQTFTTGLTGALVRVDLVLSRTSWTSDGKAIHLELHRETPEGPLVAVSDAVPASVIPFEPEYRWTTFVFSAPPLVTAGEVDAIVLPADLASYTEFDPTFLWDGTFADAYAAGVTWDGYCSSEVFGGWQSYVFGSDRTFRTWVSPSTTVVRPSWGTLKSLYR